MACLFAHDTVLSSNTNQWVQLCGCLNGKCLLSDLPHPGGQVFLQSMGQCVCTYTQAATGPLAQGVQAAGIEVALPQTVGCLVTFAQDIAVFGVVPEGGLERYIPPFIMDTWLLMTA